MLYPGQGCVDGWSGDQLLIAPPYSITEAEIDTIVDGARKAIEEALAHAPNEMFQQ
jgi:adenosylmethionine-8-amino-7-oxononanoate aminotransferase